MTQRHEGQEAARASLRAATEPEKLARDPLTHPEWGQRLTVAQYLVREQRLRAHAWARKAMTTWILVGEDGTVLSSCETYRMRSRVREAWGHTHAIASVFTEPGLRGRGLASRMLAELTPLIRASDPDAQAIILFSDVGEAIYRRAGYSARETGDWVFPAAPAEIAPPSVELLRSDELLRWVGSAPPPSGDFVIWPEPEHLDWYFEREGIYAEMLGTERPAFSAARSGDSVLAWVRLKQDYLQGLFFHAADENVAASLIRQACGAASRADLHELRVWRTENFTGWDGLALRKTLTPRAGSIPMIHPLHPGLRPEDWRVASQATWV